MSHTVTVDQNEYLPAGGTEVNAIITVTAAGDTGRPATTGTTEIIMVDSSGSMDEPGRMPAARQAAKAAVDCIRDGVHFAIIAGTHLATQIYPRPGQLAVASGTTREEAKAVISRMQAGGGTAMGQWLLAAAQLFATRPGSIAHAILLTDGENRENADVLDRVLTQVTDRFQCDCRGVGTNWKVSELRKIAQALLGTVDIVANPADLATDFQEMMISAMGKTAADIKLKVWTPVGATVTFLKQVAPNLVDLTGKRITENPMTGVYPTGSWGDESRDYHLCVTVNPGDVGDEMLAARVSVVDGDTVLDKGLVRAIWTDDTALSTKINRSVAHYTGQAELAEAIQEGLEAQRTGDIDTATIKLGRAVQLATEAGNTETASMLAQVVDIDDPVSGTVRVKRKVSAEAAMTLDTRSTVTRRARRAE